MRPLLCFLYDCVMLCTALLTAPFWLLLFWAVPKTRAGFWQKLGILSKQHSLRQLSPTKKRPRIWFHAVSVGELNAIRPLIARLDDITEDRRPEVVISTTTATGQALAKQVLSQHTIFYFPYDLGFSIQQILKHVRPDLLVLTETEIWPNLIWQVSQVAPVIHINSRLSPKSFNGYRWIKTLLKLVLPYITAFYPQSQADAERLIQLGAPEDRLTVTGNIKFDLSQELDLFTLATLRHLLGFPAGSTVITIASTHPGEDIPLITLFCSLKKTFPELRLILAPRHPERGKEIAQHLITQGLSFSQRSHLSDIRPNQSDIVILDTIGELLCAYHLSQLAVMGGSFIPHGGQNPLEAISQKIPVLYGPSMFNFTTISRLILDYHAGYQVQTTTELAEVITRLLTQPEVYSTVVENGQRLLAEHKGCCDRLITAITSHLLHEFPDAVPSSAISSNNLSRV